MQNENWRRKNELCKEQKVSRLRKDVCREKRQAVLQRGVPDILSQRKTLLEETLCKISGEEGWGSDALSEIPYIRMKGLPLHMNNRGNLAQTYDYCICGTTIFRARISV